MDKTPELKNSQEKSGLQEIVYPREQAVNFAYGFLATGSVDFFNSFLNKQKITTGEFILEVGREKLTNLVPDKDADWSKWYSFENLVKTFSEHKNVFVPGINRYIEQWIEKAGSSTSKLDFFERMGFTADQFKEPILKQIEKDLCSREDKFPNARGIKKEWKISDEEFTDLQRVSIPFRIQNGHKDLFESLWTSEQMSDPELLNKAVEGGIIALRKYYTASDSYDLAKFEETDSGALFMKLVDANKISQEQRESIGKVLASRIQTIKVDNITELKEILNDFEEVQKRFGLTIPGSAKLQAVNIYRAIKGAPKSGKNPVFLNTETIELIGCPPEVEAEFKKILVQDDDSGGGFRNFEDLGAAQDLFLQKVQDGKISIFYINSCIEKYDLTNNAPEELKEYIRKIAPSELKKYDKTLNEYTVNLIRNYGRQLFSEEEYREFENKITAAKNELREQKLKELPNRFLITEKDRDKSHTNGDNKISSLSSAINVAEEFEIDLVKLVTKEQLFTKLEQLLSADSSGRGEFISRPDSLQQLLGRFEIEPREFLNHVGIEKFTEELIFKNSDHRYTPEDKLRDMFNVANLYEFSTAELQYVFKEVIGREFGNYSFSVQDLDSKFKYHAEYLFGAGFKEVFEQNARDVFSKQFFGIDGSLNHSQIITDIDILSESTKNLWEYYGFTKDDFNSEALAALALYNGLEMNGLAIEIQKHFPVKLDMLKDQNTRSLIFDKVQEVVGKITVPPGDVIMALGRSHFELSTTEIVDIFPTIKRTIETVQERFPGVNAQALSHEQLIELEGLFFKRESRRGQPVLMVNDSFDWWANAVKIMPEATSTVELEELFPEAAEFANKIREKVPELSEKLLESVLWFCEFSQERDLDTVLESFKKSPFLVEAIDANPRYSMKLITKFPYLDNLSQQNISQLYTVKSEVKNENSNALQDALEYRSATQIKLLDYKNNRAIAEKISEQLDLNQWLNYDRESYFALGGQEKMSFAEMVKTPVLRINETISIYRDSIKEVLGEYTQELSKFRIPLESADEVNSSISRLQQQIAEANEQGQTAKATGMTKGLRSLEQKRDNLKTAPLWNKIMGDFDSVVQVGQDVLVGHDLITAAEQANNIPVEQVMTKEERAKYVELKKRMGSLQSDFKEKLNLLDRRMNQFTQSISGLIEPCLGKDRSDALMQDLKDRTLEALDHFSSDITSTQETIAARDSQSLSKLDGRTLKVGVWSRDPDVDLYLGNYTNCCIRIDSDHMGDESTIADYLTDLGIQVIKVTDEQTDEPVVAAWAYVGESENGKPTLVIDNIEANTQYSSPYQIQIRDRLSEYVKEYAAAIGVPSENIIQGSANNDIVLDVRLGEADKLGSLYNRVGGYYLEAETDDEYGNFDED